MKQDTETEKDALQAPQTPTEPETPETPETPNTPDAPAAPAEPEAPIEPPCPDAAQDHAEPADPPTPDTPADSAEAPSPAEASSSSDAPAPAKKSRLSAPVRALLAVAAALAAAALLLVWYVNGKLDLLQYSDGSAAAQRIGAEEDQDLDGTGLELSDDEMDMPDGSPFADDDVLNILLIGTDERTEAVNDADAFTHLNQLDGTEDTTEFSDDARADTLILVSLNIKEDTIKLVSIERGTGVPVDLPWEEETQYDWITHTFRYGGAKLSMETVESCFGVQVDHYIRVNFNSFVQIVDAVGGVDLDLTEEEAAALNWEVPSNSMLIVNKVSAGVNHFDGYTALQYARLRSIDNDWHRIERQRTVIQAVLDQVQSASVLELDNLLNTVLPLVQTNFTKSEIAALLVQLPGFLGVEAEQLSLPAEGTYGVRTGMDDRLMYDPDWAANRRILQRFLYGTTGEEAEQGYYEDSAAALTLDPAAQTVQQTAVLAMGETPETAAEEEPQPLSDDVFGTGGAQVYLLGTDGGDTADTAELKEAFTRYLHENQGVDLILLNESVAAGGLLERYLQTGREDALQDYLAVQSEAEAAAAEAYARWLYAYNAAQGYTLHAAGLLPEDGTAAARRLLAALLDPGDDVREDYAGIIGGIESGRPSALYALRKAVDENYYHARKLFGDNWALAHAVLQSLAQESGEGLNGAAMLSNYSAALALYPDTNAFGVLDAAQIFQADCAYGDTPQGSDRFGIRLADAGISVCSILAVCPDAEPDGLAAVSVLEKNCPDALTETTFIPLDGPATPYDAANDLLTAPADDTLGLTAYFQKLLTLPALPEAAPETAAAETATPETAAAETAAPGAAAPDGFWGIDSPNGAERLAP